MLTQKPINSKIAERLKILHKRTKCVLTQIHYLKYTLLIDTGFFAKFCATVNYDPALKLLNKKFPNIDIKANRIVLEPLISQHVAILRELQFHYNTLVDVLEIKDNLFDLLGQISAFQFTLDIALNTEMTELYLDLVVDYSCIMIMLSTLTQIQTILSLYNLAFLSKFDLDESVYPRLCERLVEKHKDGCVTELYNELNPYSRMLLGALATVSTLLPSKLAKSTDWEQARTFELSTTLACPDSVKSPSLTALLPLSRIYRWLFFGYLVLYPEILRSQTILATFRSLLESASVVVIFRDDLFVVHSTLSKFFGSQKGLSKLVTLVKDSQREFVSHAITFRRSRRNYLRLLMRHQLHLLCERPAIIATNIMQLCHLIACASDEVLWMFAHIDQPQSKKASAPVDYTDQQLPEFLYHIEEIRYLVTQFDIVANYYRIVLVDRDSAALANVVSGLSLTEDEMGIISSVIDTVADPTITNYTAVRLDWLRLQTFLACQSNFMKYTPLVHVLNNIDFHTRLVENIPSFLNKFSSLELLCFHSTTLHNLFDNNLKLAAQHRYAVVFPRICGQFLASSSPDCPEDFNLVLRLSIDMANTFLSRICQELCKLMNNIIRSHFELSQMCNATNAVDLYNLHFYKRTKEHNDSSGKHGPIKYDSSQLPGSESRRTSVEADSNFDRELISLSNLSFALNSRPLIINNLTFHPATYLKKEIVKFLNEKLVSLANVKFKREKHEGVIGARRTSEMKMLITECMSVITRISEYTNINVSIIFMEVFLSQSLNKDPLGRTTLTEIYSNWYVDFVLNQPYILHSPLLKCFVTIAKHTQKESSSIAIDVEELTDIAELRALVEVIGPFGMRNINDRIMQSIVKNVSSLRRFVQRNRATLIELNVINLEYSKVKKLLHDIGDVDEFCQNWKQMGILFAFKDLCRNAVQNITMKSMPFLKATVNDLQQDLDTEPMDNISSVSESENSAQYGFKNQLILNELCQGFGLKTKMDSSLFNALESIKLQQSQLQAGQQENVNQNEELQNELLMVATSYLLPRLVGSNFYRIEYEALEDNAHCAAYAIKELMYAFFSRHGDDRLAIEIRKFIGLTSSNLLRLGIETGPHIQNNKESMLIKNRDSIYIFFDFVIQTLENVSNDFYEECFPYALVRQAYHNVVKQSRQVMVNAAHPTDVATKAALEASKIEVK